MKVNQSLQFIYDLKFPLKANFNSIINYSMKSSSEEFSKVALSCLESNSLSFSKTIDNVKKAKLNLFGKGITFVKPLAREEIALFQSIKQIDLSHNALTSIDNLNVLPLHSLNLAHNKIAQQDKIIDLFIKHRNCQISKNIKKIFLKGNPFLKKPLSPEILRWFFCVQNDLDIFVKEEHQYLEQLIQKLIEKILLQNLLHKVSINLEFIQSIRQTDEDYQKLILLRPQEYFKVIKRQMEWKIQAQPLTTVKRQIIMNLPIELFLSNRQKSQLRQYASSLTLELRKRNQNLIKNNKQILKKIQNTILNYLTQKKVNIEEQQKTHSLPIQKNIKNSKEYYQSLEYPYAFTPNDTKKRSRGKSQQPLIAEEPIPIFKFTKSPKIIALNQESDLFKQPVHKQSHHSPKLVMKQLSKNKENIKASYSLYSSKSKNKQSNNSKTLLQLSQSLLQKSCTSNKKPLYFDLEDQIAQNQVQKMFFQILIKANPIYHLLYSPLQSLKPSEKSSLITNLLQLLKQKLKYIQKLQKFKLLYETQRQKNDELNISSRKQKQCMENILYKKQSVSIELKQVEQQLKTLSLEIQSKTQQNILLQQQNQKLRQQLCKYQQIRLERQEEQRIENLITINRQKNLKQKFIHLLNKKSYKFLSYITNITQIKTIQKFKISQFYFRSMAKETQITKKFQLLKRKYLFIKFYDIKSTLLSTIRLKKDLTKKLASLLKLQITNYSKLVLQKLFYIHTIQQKNKTSQLHYDKKIKCKLFKLLTKNLQVEKSIQYDCIIDQFKINQQKHLQKTVFNEWLVWKKELIHKQVQIRLNHEGILACNVIGHLCQFYSKQRSHLSRSLSLQLYLRDIRKFNNFHRLFFFMSTQIQKKKLKLFKINIFTKRIFFDKFLSGIRYKKNKRKIKQKDSQITKRKLQFNQLNEFKLKKKIITYKVKNKLKNVYRQMIVSNLFTNKKQIEVGNLIQKYKFGLFFDKIKQIHKIKTHFKSKCRQIHYFTRKSGSSLKQLSQKSFFLFLRLRLGFKRSLVNFFIKKNKRLLNKTFYQLRINSLEQKAFYFEQKLKEIGPDIDLIQQRQIQTNIEKINLSQQLEIRNQQIQQYEKELRELRLLLEAKQIKYEKLKDIYAESIEIHARERDFYNLQQIFTPEMVQFDLKNSIKSKNLQNEPYLQKTIKLDSKEYLMPQPFPERKYSPERDTKVSKQKRRMPEYMLQSDRNNNSIKQEKIKIDILQKQKLAGFYPSFRRF